MKSYKIKDLFNGLSTDSLLFDSYLSSFYPTIEGNESNFLDDYDDSHAVFDQAFAKKYGERFMDLEADTLSDAITEARGIFSAVTMLNLNNWARLYYALSLDYNPLYNVDGLTTHTYGATEETTAYGADKTTNKMAQRQDTNQYGATEATTTDYSNAYDVNQDSETGKTVSSDTTHTDTLTTGAHNDEIARDAHTDKRSTIQHIDTELRQGNIGVTKSTDLLTSEYDMRMRLSFWNVVFKSLVTEGGAYYDYQAL